MKFPLPKVIGLALLCLAVLSLCLTWAAMGWQRQAGRPALEKSYDQFVADVNGKKVTGVEMYRDILQVTAGTESYWVRSVSDSYTVELLIKHRVPLRGLEQPTTYPGASAQVAYLLALLFPYVILGSVVLLMVRSVSAAVSVQSDSVKADSPKASA
ncbi:MAG: hypothetical protein K6A35_00475 [bacterium]|nr:hypothetical protein [bacterium]